MIVIKEKLLAALRSSGQTPRYHGNGFGQLYVAEHVRLHVWSLSIPPIPNHNAAIHDHTYDMESEVLLGGITHITYDQEFWYVGSAPYVEYELEAVPGAKARPKVNGKPVKILCTGYYDMREGDVYAFARNKLHQTKRQEGFTKAATLMRKFPKPDDRAQPHVIAPFGEVPVDAFGKHLPGVEHLWQAFEEAIQLMSGSACLKIVQAMGLANVINAGEENSERAKL